MKKPNQLLLTPDPSLEKSGSSSMPLRTATQALQRDPRLHQREQERSGNLWSSAPEAPLNIGAVERHPEVERVYQIGRKEGENG